MTISTYFQKWKRSKANYRQTLVTWGKKNVQTKKVNEDDHKHNEMWKQM
jgi:hypothetical protein